MVLNVKAIAICLAACVLLASCVPPPKAEPVAQPEVERSTQPQATRPPPPMKPGSQAITPSPTAKVMQAKSGESCAGFLTGCSSWCKKNDPINDGCTQFCTNQAARCRTTGQWAMDEGARVVVDLPPDPPPPPTTTATFRQALPRESCAGYSTGCQEWCAKNKPGDKACANYCTEQLASCRTTGQWIADNGTRVVTALPPETPPTTFQRAKPRETCTGYSTTCRQWCTRNRAGDAECANYCTEQLESCRTTGQWSMDNGERTVTGLQPR